MTRHDTTRALVIPCCPPALAASGAYQFPLAGPDDRGPVVFEQRQRLAVEVRVPPAAEVPVQPRSPVTPQRSRSLSCRTRRACRVSRVQRAACACGVRL
jgi:hypothetical protein